MTTVIVARTLCLLATASLATSIAWAAPQQPLDEVGNRLRARYVARLEALEADISRALPVLSEHKKSAYLQACAAKTAAAASVEAAEQRLTEIGTAQGLVEHAKGKWIVGADRGIAAAMAKLQKATTDDERKVAHKELAEWQKNRAEGVRALEERQARLDQLERDKPRLEQELGRAKQALASARAATMSAMQDLGLAALLTSDSLDAKLAGYVALKEATPHGLAAFAQQGEAQQKLVERMLDDGGLLVQMAVADGANGGNYGRAMEIYRDVQQASSRAGKGHLQRLALAVALEHAVPIAQRNAEAAVGAPPSVDPVRRYLHYEHAFLAGELDPAFQHLSVWDYRMVVYGEEPDEILAWGREMLRNYRPDQVTNPDYRWRYVDAVRTDVRYGSQDDQHDEPGLQFFQNILKNGGVCGRRAFYGRFLLRAFGIPTTARPQRGHAALVHWTPDGWVPCLGAGWGSGWTKTRYDKDLDFLATTQARAAGAAFLQVKRAQWIGDVLGEPRTFGFLSGSPSFWYGVSLHTQQAIIDAAQAKALDAVGQDIAEANETKEQVAIARVILTDEDRRVVVDGAGEITIPAAATSKPTKSNGKILFLNSILGGKQLHYSRNGGAQDFEYAFDAPAAGRYALTARVVTPSWQQRLLVMVNDAKTPVVVELPFTVGRWERTHPVEVELIAGRNLLRFAHGSDGFAKGFSIRDFTLTPK